MLLLLVATIVVSGNLFAQSIQVKGIVNDDSNQPLPGVSVVIKGTHSGTITGSNGTFTITVTAGQTLEFSSIGQITKKIIVADAAFLAVVLISDGKTLSEVVITALGVKKEVRKIGYSVSEIKGADLTIARDPNPINSLVGKVAGLSVGASAEFFGRPQLVLRESTDLLYIVDGVPISSDTYNVSADDIESYTILKGPNAAALYGFRGVNGAIVISTKRGTKDKKGWSIDFNSTNVFEHGFIVNPVSQTEYGRGKQFKYSYGDVLYDNKQRLPEWGPRFEGQLVKQYDSPYDPITGIRTATPYKARGANNFTNFAQTGMITTDNISLATTGDKSDVRLSYSHTYQKGMFPNTRLNLDNFNINTGYNFSSTFRVEGNLNLNVQYSPNIPDVSYGPNSYSYMFKVYGSADYDVNSLKDIYKGPMGVNNLVQYAPEYGRENSAYFIAQKWLRSQNKTDIFGYLKATYKFNNDLDLTVREQVSTWNQLRTEQVPSSTNLNTYLPWYYFGWYGDYREDRRNLMESNTDAILNFKKNLDGFNIAALAGANARSFVYTSSWATTKDLSLPNVYNLANSQNPILSYNFNSKMQVYSAFYSIDLGYKNYFNINTTNRVDKLSTLPSSNNTYYYPSVAFSTVLTEYLNLPHFISFVKLRASAANVKGGLTSPTIGTAYNALISTGTGSAWNSNPVGNLLGYGSELYSGYDGPTYQNSSPGSASTYYNGTPSVALSSTKANPGIKPFSVQSQEAGIDVKFMQNRLGLDATYFRTVNGPVIFPLSAAPSTGFSNQIVNGVTTLKKGIELSLTGAVLKSVHGLNWDVNLNYSTLKETLKSIFPGQAVLEQNGHDYKNGDRLDGLYSTKFVHDPKGNIVYDGGGLPLQSPGGISNNGLLGYANPNFSFGINNKFSYRAISFSFQFDGRIGGKIYDQTYYHANNGGTSIESARGAFGAARLADWNVFKSGGKVVGSYVGPGVVIASGTPQYAGGQIINPNDLTFAPNATAATTQSFISSGIGGNFDEYYTISRSYAKLREVTLGFTVPQHWLQGSLIKHATFSLVGRNLLYFAARKDIDLDQYASGYNASDRSLQGGSGSIDLQTQTARRYGFNLNIGF